MCVPEEPPRHCHPSLLPAGWICLKITQVCSGKLCCYSVLGIRAVCSFTWMLPNHSEALPSFASTLVPLSCSPPPLTTSPSPSMSSSCHRARASPPSTPQSHCGEHQWCKKPEEGQETAQESARGFSCPAQPAPLLCCQGRALTTSELWMEIQAEERMLPVWEEGDSSQAPGADPQLV